MHNNDYFNCHPVWLILAVVMLLCRLRGKKKCSWWAKVSTSVNCGRNGPGSIVNALMYMTGRRRSYRPLPGDGDSP